MMFLNWIRSHKKKGKHVIAAICFAAFILFSQMGMIANSDSYWGVNATTYLSSLRYNWYDFLFGGVDHSYPLLFGYAVASALNLLHLSFANAGVVFLLLLSVWYVAYQTACLLLRPKHHIEKQLIAAASLFVIANEMMRAFLSTNITIIWGTFFMFLAIYFYLRAIIHRQTRHTVISVLFFNCAFIDFHSALLAGIFIASFSFLAFIGSIFQRNKQVATRAVYSLVLFGFLALILNLYWIGGVLYDELHHTGMLSGYASNAGITRGVLDIYNGYNNLSYNILLSTSNALRKSWLDTVDIICTSIVVGISLSSLIFIRKKRDINIFYLVLLAFLFVSLGFGPLNPLGIFDVAWNRIPGFILFRDFFKFYRVLILIYAVLLSYVVTRKAFNKYSRFMLVFLCILFLAKTSLYVVYAPRFKPFSVPSYYQEYQRAFENNPEDSHITIMPIFSAHFWFDWPNHANYDIQDPIRYYPTKPVIMNTATSQEGLFEHFNKQMVLSFADEKNRELFFVIAGMQNIHYFLIREDYSQAFLQSHRASIPESREVLDVAGLIRIADRDSRIQKIGVYGKLHLYKIKQQYYIPHIFIPIKSTFSDVDVGTFVSNSFNELQSRVTEPLNSVTFYSSQNAGRTIFLSELQDYASAWQSPPILEYRKISPVKYRIRIHGASGTFPLVFSETFHQNWLLYQTPYPDGPSTTPHAIVEVHQESDDQATSNDIQKYLKNGWISNIISPQTGRHEYVSKAIQNTIQNDNLPSGYVHETWFTSLQKNNVREMERASHSVANISTNSWVIDSNAFCKTSTLCRQRPDGTYDIELVLEYFPQRIRVIGLFLSISSLLGCLLFILFAYWPRSKKPPHA